MENRVGIRWHSDISDVCVQECLKEFGNNPDVVISHVLYNTLPPRLQQMHQQAPRYCVHLVSFPVLLSEDNKV